MCGIAGYIYLDSTASAGRNTLVRMTDTLRHRGPDDAGYYVHNNAALGHRRLSIIDLNTGDQPMVDPETNMVIVYNGEIYNYIELRDELITKGHLFKTESDTEVILKAYAEWGVECQNKFNGMWAFAIYQPEENKLFISRDRIGEKPLYYSFYNGALIFASEIKAILEYGVPAEPNFEVLELYLSLTYIPAPYSFYKYIHKLDAGQYMVLDNGKEQLSEYWRLPDICESDLIHDEKKILTRFEELFYDAVKIRMRSDVPFGAFLSGGLDSSCVIAVMSDIAQLPVEAFTIRFDDADFDESRLAALAAKKFQCNHHLETVTADEFDEVLRKIVYHYDEPFGDSSAIPTGQVSEYAANYVKMVLTGDGGDEALSGYNAYLGIRYLQKFNRFPAALNHGFAYGLSALSKFLRGAPKYKLERRAGFFRSASESFVNRFAEKLSFFPLPELRTLLNEYPDRINLIDYLQQIERESGFKDDFYKLMFYHFKVSLPNDILVKVDRMSMASSLETRIPFLDYRIVELLYTAHKDVKYGSENKQKNILRQTVGKRLPAELLSAPKKGFRAPVREWFRNPDFEHKFSKLFDIPLEFDNRIIDKLISDTKAGKKDYGNAIWALFVLAEAIKKNHNT